MTNELDFRLFSNYNFFYLIYAKKKDKKHLIPSQNVWYVCILALVRAKTKKKRSDMLQ